VVEAPPEGTVLLSGGYFGEKKAGAGGFTPFFLRPTKEGANRI
jgi:hypothetical protein